MEHPSWYGVSYPTAEDLEALAVTLHVVIVETNVPFALYFADPLGVGVGAIVLPEHHTGLARVWDLAHELGHAIQHSGRKSAYSYGKEESQANRWAACALIPEARIRSYSNACLDAFIAALSANYEDIPLVACPLRELAAKIAAHRLQALEKEVA